MRHYEACSCEARIEVRTWRHTEAVDAINTWRERHEKCSPKPADEPHPEGDTYTSTERTVYRGPSIGFEPNLPQARQEDQ